MSAAVAERDLPSHMRCVPGSVNIPIATFPSTSNPSIDASDPEKVASDFIDTFNSALAGKSCSALADLFTDGGYWRDHLALTWAFRTAQSPAKIQELLETSASSRDGFRLQSIALDKDQSSSRKPQIASVDPLGNVQGVQFFIGLTTAIGSGVGVVKLVEQDGKWKIFTLYTKLEQLRGYEETLNSRRPQGVEHGDHPGRKNWAEKREQETTCSGPDEPAVLILGAGQAGLTAAATLKALGVNSLMLDQNERVGDNWRQRYHQLVLHDPVWYDHMPYLKFPPQWPIFTPKDKLAQFFESYATLLELNVWTSATIVKSSWDDASQTWEVVVERKMDNHTEVRTFHPRHIIQATGHSGKKNHPDLKGADSFLGSLCHSSDFKGARILKTGETRKVVVVGSCNSAHDIAQDFLEKSYQVTIVQRSSTLVASSKAMCDIAMKGLYEENGPPVDDADLLMHGMPSAVFKAVWVQLAKAINTHDAPLLAGLASAGFMVDSGPDAAGLMLKYLQRGGGYYIDVGASSLIAAGKIRVKQGQEISEVVPGGLRFADGSEVEADEVVLATGYQNMRTQTRALFGDAVADRVGDVWGFNHEGEIRAMWQRSGHPGLWFHGGNLALCRFYSRLLAVQILGRERGLFKDGEV